MKQIISLLTLTITIVLSSCEVASEREYFQLKTYHYHSVDQESSLDRYLENALIPALHRARVEPVGVFKPIGELNEGGQYTMLLLPFGSLQEFESLQGLLEEDMDYQDAAKGYIMSPHDTPPYDRIETILLRAFSATPVLSVPELDSPRKERVYELRSYQAATEHLYERKVEMFNEGESALFEKLGFNPVFFGEVLSSNQMPHLMYMTTHADTTAQKENWDAFRVHPDWLGMKDLERYRNTVSHIDRYLMYPTDYSDY